MMFPKGCVLSLFPSIRTVCSTHREIRILIRVVNGELTATMLFPLFFSYFGLIGPYISFVLALLVICVIYSEVDTSFHSHAEQREM